MTVRVDTLTTDVVAEAAQPVGAEDARQGMEWQEQERAAALRARAARDEMRIRAAGFDD
jgi:hypothetical protein